MTPGFLFPEFWSRTFLAFLPGLFARSSSRTRVRV